jgi:hypothetical protein
MVYGSALVRQQGVRSFTEHHNQARTRHDIDALYASERYVYI